MWYYSPNAEHLSDKPPGDVVVEEAAAASGGDGGGSSRGGRGGDDTPTLATAATSVDTGTMPREAAADVAAGTSQTTTARVATRIGEEARRTSIPSDEEINADIRAALFLELAPSHPSGVSKDEKEGGATFSSSSSFEFVWYENPKMSIPGIYHVQVFWRVLPVG
jgi:hypothetical protein